MHIMIDFETLSTKINAVIVTAGIAAFDPTSEGIMWSSSYRFNVGNQMYQLKRHVDWDTIKWWMQQADDARKLMTQATVADYSLENWLQEFAASLDWEKVDGIWSHGLNFDIVILENAYRESGMKPPWHYRAPRDTRTLFWLAGMGKDDLVPPTIAHSAEADAIACALSVQKAYKIINENIPQ